MESSIAAVVVIYNKKVEESITCKKILDNCHELVEVIIIDNSTADLGNKEYCLNKKLWYISMKGNKGLSKAYNTAIDACKEKDVIILFDDDTEVTEEYFLKLFSDLTEYPEIDIFAPTIYGQDGVIYSPNKYNFMRNNFITEKNKEIPQDKFNAIASCLAIRMRVFDNYRFNEKLFVDQVDQNFFYEQRKLNRKFKRLDVKILQNFYQRGDRLTPRDGWRRLKLRIVDIMRQTRLIGGGKIRFLGFVKCCGLGIQIGKKSRSFVIPFKAFGLALKCAFIDK